MLRSAKAAVAGLLLCCKPASADFDIEALAAAAGVDLTDTAEFVGLEVSEFPYRCYSMKYGASEHANWMLLESYLFSLFWLRGTEVIWLNSASAGTGIPGRSAWTADDSIWYTYFQVGDDALAFDGEVYVQGCEKG